MNGTGDRRSALTAGIDARVREAHSRWEEDCLALDLKLSEAGLPFGASGYKLAAERGAYRLVEGVTLALDYVAKHVSPRSPDWSLLHQSILDAVEGQFLASSRLIPAPEADPMLAVASQTAKEQVWRHCEEARGSGWLQRLSAALTLPGWLRLP